MNKNKNYVEQKNSHINNKNPNFYITKYFTLVLRFQEIKECLKSHNENYLDNLLFNLGMRAASFLKCPNFYHFCSEAWILTLFETMLHQDNDLHLESFNKLLEKIKKIKIDENRFTDNLEILLGTYKLHEQIIKVTQVNLSLIYIKKISQALKETTGRIDIQEEINQEKFEDFIFLAMVMAVNYSLNELNSKIQNKDSLLFMNIFTELNHDQKLKSGDFIEEVMKFYKISEDEEVRKSQSEYYNTEIELMNPSIIFYDFARTNLQILTRDLEAFIYNSSDVLTKLRLSIRQKVSSARKYFKSISNYLNKFSPSLINRKSLFRYFLIIYEEIFILKVKTVNNIKWNYHMLKSWINASGIGYSIDYLNDKIGYLKNNFIIEKIYQPVKYFIFKNLFRSIEITILTVNFTREMLVYLKKLVRKGIVSILGKGPYLIFIDDKDEGYLKFEINKELIPITNTKINQVLSFIKNSIQFSFAYHVITKVNFKIPNLLYDKYKSFLSFCSQNSLEKKELTRPCT